MVCIECGKQLVFPQIKYCSTKCNERLSSRKYLAKKRGLEFEQKVFNVSQGKRLKQVRSENLTDEDNYKNICLHCGELINLNNYFSEKYCSYECSRLYHKSIYRKAHREQLNKYNRKYRKGKVRIKSNQTNNKSIELINIQKSCLKCGTAKNLQIHHIVSRGRGGQHENGNIMLLCRKHHHEFEQLTASYFDTNKYNLTII